MTRRVAALVAVLTVLASAGAGFGAFLLVRDGGSRWPQISAYSHGQLIRVGPYQYCTVLNLDDCETPRTLGVLGVNRRDPVQLSVPSAISRAPWVLAQVYQDGPVVTQFPPGARTAVTVTTVDPHRGRLQGIVVQLLTLVRMPDDDLRAAVHAEWSVHTVWD